MFCRTINEVFKVGALHDIAMCDTIDIRRVHVSRDLCAYGQSDTFLIDCLFSCVTPCLIDCVLQCSHDYYQFSSMLWYQLRCSCSSCVVVFRAAF